jgi:hypothetical protein
MLLQLVLLTMLPTTVSLCLCGPCCSFVLVLVLCFGNGTTETLAESPMDAEIAAESAVQADLDL